MAGDWIKMRGNLWDDPRVAKLVDMTDSSEAAVVGGLYWLWATADQHSTNGVMPGLSVKGIDRKTGIAGFGEALVLIGWLADHSEGVRVTKFEEHNGESAKKRCQTAKRVAAHKSGNAQVTQTALPKEHESVSGALPREREEIEKEKSKKEERESASPNGSRLPADWQLPDEWAEWAVQTRPELNPNETAQRFADYWHGVAGAKGRKADWQATWRNWVRGEKAPPRATPSAVSFAERDEMARRRRWEEMTGRKWPTEQSCDVIDVLNVAESENPMLTHRAF